MRIYSGVSLLTGRPYAGIGCGVSLRSHRSTRTQRRATAVRLDLLHDRAVETARIAEASNRRVALQGLLGLDAMLAAAAREQDWSE